MVWRDRLLTAGRESPSEAPSLLTGGREANHLVAPDREEGVTLFSHCEGGVILPSIPKPTGILFSLMPL